MKQNKCGHGEMQKRSYPPIIPVDVITFQELSRYFFSQALVLTLVSTHSFL